jgi:toxin-antitoxin system PIN domain toxin
MRALLDVNVLIALLDSDHALHERADDWFAAHARQGWASCPITENGCIRIMSHPAYPNAIHAGRVAERLREAASDQHHEFWPDDLSILDISAFDSTRIHGPRQITDVYLLALAVRHGGRFVTFDLGVSGAAVRDAETRHLLVI